eukprot:270443-Rhodomonas_salina.3
MSILISIGPLTRISEGRAQQHKPPKCSILCTATQASSCPHPEFRCCSNPDTEGPCATVASPKFSPLPHHQYHFSFNQGTRVYQRLALLQCTGASVSRDHKSRCHVRFRSVGSLQQASTTACGSASRCTTSKSNPKARQRRTLCTRRAADCI